MFGFTHLREWTSRLLNHPLVAHQRLLDQIDEILEKTMDPETGLGIMDLQMVEAVGLDGPVAHLRIHPTHLSCALTKGLEAELKRQIEGLGLELHIDWVYFPPWTPDRLNPDIKMRYLAIKAESPYTPATCGGCGEGCSTETKMNQK